MSIISFIIGIHTQIHPFTPVCFLEWGYNLHIVCSLLFVHIIIHTNTHTLLWISFNAAAAAAAVVSNSVRSQRRQPTRLPRPWDSAGKSTGVGCHFLLQCMKVKSESEVTQSCPTLCDPMDCSLPGSSVHGIFQARVLEWGAITFSHLSMLVPINYMMKWPYVTIGLERKRHRQRQRDTATPTQRSGMKRD